MTRDRTHNKAPSRFRLYRNRRRGRLAGVCAGIADFFDVNTAWVRLATIVAAFLFTVPVVIGYLLLAWLLDEAPDTLYKSDKEEAFWRRANAQPSGTARDLRHKFRTIEKRIRDMETHVTSAKYDLDRQFRDLERE